MGESNKIEYFALMAPISTAAEEALRQRDNRFILHDSANHGLPKPKHSRRRKGVVAVLARSTSIGKRYHMIGTARGSAVRLSKNVGVERQHFYVRLDPDSNILFLTVVSEAGISYNCVGADGALQVLNRGTIRVDRDTFVKVGELDFLIRPGLATGSGRELSRRRSHGQVDGMRKSSVPRRCSLAIIDGRRMDLSGPCVARV